MEVNELERVVFTIDAELKRKFEMAMLNKRDKSIRDVLTDMIKSYVKKHYPDINNKEKSSEKKSNSKAKY